MSIYNEKAKELADLILESEQAKTMADARNVFENDENAKARMQEFQVYQMEVQKSFQEGDLSQEEAMKLQQNLAEKVVELKQDEIIGALVFAENEFNGFVNGVMNVLKNRIMGIEEEGCGCGGGCGSSCGSSCGSEGCNC